MKKLPLLRRKVNLLTISEIALKYRISYKQVNDLIDYGFLPVTYTKRTPNKGVKLFFSESDINNLDIPSVLAEINDMKRKGIKKNTHYDFKKVIGVINYYDRFMESISYHPDEKLLRAAFYLFHLNHYAKKYEEQSKKLYNLKNQVIKKMYQTNPDKIEAVYLVGPDRKKVWLCEDCKDSARAAGMPYVSYIRSGYHCPKCFVQSVEKEYYSLVEFIINTSEHRFTFHLPRNTAQKWIKDIYRLPQEIRETGRSIDKMYLYGRQIGRIEEKVFPLSMIIQKLEDYFYN